ncbi:hypothetical protein [Flexibacterium corallicola]|uniref:hypothetical protein n=1 Tax=Flexibacterium corallicola TaxID=3037259 RepID=UPI00286F56E3|nr:hypothetical protein [Pseudovibrio sp. M1P-2-3]
MEASAGNYSIVMGLLYYVLAVYGYVGKVNLTEVPSFLGLEAVRVVTSSTILGFILGRIFRRHQ